MPTAASAHLPLPDFTFLTAAQKMHHNWILDYGTQQVSGVSVVASVQAELDFGLLKKCIQMETERSGCTRVRFTKPDKEGNVKQYIEKQDQRDIELKDLSGMESLAKADELMQQWAYEYIFLIIQNPVLPVQKPQRLRQIPAVYHNPGSSCDAFSELLSKDNNFSYNR